MGYLLLVEVLETKLELFIFGLDGFPKFLEDLSKKIKINKSTKILNRQTSTSSDKPYKDKILVLVYVLLGLM